MRFGRTFPSKTFSVDKEGIGSFVSLLRGYNHFSSYGSVALACGTSNPGGASSTAWNSLSSSDSGQKMAGNCSVFLSANCKGQKGDQRPLVSFLVRKVPLGSSALPPVRASTALQMFSPLSGPFPKRELPTTRVPAPGLPFCILAEDAFAFAIKKTTSVVNFHLE